MSGNINSNSNFDAISFQQQQQQIQQQEIKDEESGISVRAPLSTKAGDVLEASSALVKQDNTAAMAIPTLPSSIDTVTVQNSSPNPNPGKYTDLLDAYKQVSTQYKQAVAGPDDMSMVDYLSAIGKAINDAEALLAEIQNNHARVIKRLNQSRDVAFGQDLSERYQQLDLLLKFGGLDNAQAYLNTLSNEDQSSSQAYDQSSLQDLDLQSLMDQFSPAVATGQLSPDHVANILTANSDKTTSKKALTSKQSETAPGGLSDLQGFLQSTLKGANISPKVEQYMMLLGQLEYLSSNAKANVTEGVILSNYPQLVALMQQLNVEIPSNPDGPFAGIGKDFANKGKPPYDNPDYAALAKNLSPGWEVIAKPDLLNLIIGVAGSLQKELGDSYGLLAKPLQQLFGASLFSAPRPPVDPQLQVIKDRINEIQQGLDALKNPTDDYAPFEIQRGSYLYEKLLRTSNLVALPLSMRTMAQQTPLYLRITKADLKAVIYSLKYSFDQKGGEEALNPEEASTPTKTGEGLFATGAVGDISSPVASMLTQLFGMEMDNAYEDSTLTSSQLQSMRSLASTAILSTVLGQAVHYQLPSWASTDSQYYQQANASMQNLADSIKTLTESGAANNIVEEILGGSGSTGVPTQSPENLSDFQISLLQNATQAFMVNIGVSTATSAPSTANAKSATITSQNANKALNALSKNVDIAEDPASSVAVNNAQVFLNSNSDRLDDKSSYRKMLAQMGFSGLTRAEQDEADSIQQMIKMLKKIMEELLSGGNISKKLGSAVSDVSESLNPSDMPFNISTANG